MKDQQILLLGSAQLQLKHIARELSKVHLTCSIESCLEKAHKKLSKIRYKGILVGQCTVKEKTEEFCRNIRSNDPSVSIVVMLIEQNPQLEYQLLDMGVDDVVIGLTHWKVVSKRIFVRITNCLSHNHSDNTIYLGGVLVDTKNLEVWNQGKLKTITLGQLELLQYLINNAGKVISRKEICESLWKDSIVDPMGKNFDMQVSNLRRLVEIDPKKPKFIRTIRGVGYLFAFD